MTTYATTSDVAERWRPLTEAEKSVALTFLDHASLLIRAAIPNIESRFATEPDLRDLTRHEVAESVRRALLNPEGWREVGIDDFRRVRDAAVSSGALYLSDDQIVRLRPGGASRRRAFAVDLTPVP